MHKRKKEEKKKGWGVGKEKKHKTRTGTVLACKEKAAACTSLGLLLSIFFLYSAVLRFYIVLFSVFI